MRKWLIVLSALLVAPVSAAPAWTWVDANGTVHFSDTPVPGAKQIELSGAQSFSATPRAQPAPPPPPPGASTQPEQNVAYRSFTIASPAAEETLWNIGGTLTVRLSIEPALQRNHRVDVYLDGQRRNLNATGTTVSVPDVFRGMHTVQAVIVDQRGTEVLRSPPVSFVVQQTSIQNPQRAR